MLITNVVRILILYNICRNALTLIGGGEFHTCDKG